MQSAARTYAQYGSTDLVAIMNQAREDLRTVGLQAFNSHWFKNSAIANFVVREMKLPDLSKLGPPDDLRNPDQMIGSVACGYIPGPIYEYDLVSAFASTLLDVPQVADYVRQLDQYRSALADTASSHLIKVTQSVLPGKLLSQYGTSKYHNPYLGHYTRARTRKRLKNAMNEALNRYGTVFRWYIDGFYTNVDIRDYVSNDNIADGEPGRLGGWKTTVHDYLLIADTSLFTTNLKTRDNGYTDIDWHAIRDDPLKVSVTRTQVDWERTLEERTQRLKLLFENGHHRCTYCRDGYHLTRESWDLPFV
jgi:hypothetical protein